MKKLRLFTLLALILMLTLLALVGCKKENKVESVYLMSGVYDLNVVVKGKSLQDVANFVAKELSAMDSVTSTATHFVMRRYKELDVELLGSGKDERGSFWL